VRTVRPDWNPVAGKLQDFSDLTVVRDYFFLGLAAMIALDAGASFIGHVTCQIFQADYIPVMDNRT
jgi:hypothetical protein